MKKENKQLNDNISRLIKSSTDFEAPSKENQKQFADSLINQALQALDQNGEKDNTMNENNDNTQHKTNRGRSKLFRFSAIAITSMAAMIGICYIFMPTLGKSRSSSVIRQNQTKQQYSQQAPKPTELKQTEDMDFTGGTSVAVSLEEEARVKSEIIAGRPASPKVKMAESYSLAKGLQPVYPPVMPPIDGSSPVNGQPVDAMFFKNYGVNPFVDTDDDNLSTFASDVDTASFLMAKRYLFEQNALPPEEAIRVEEFVNYFDYGYPSPSEDNFAIYTETAKWDFANTGRDNTILKIGVKAKEISDQQRTPAVLTFVIDVSGSMNRENRLGLVKQSLRYLVDRLKSEDMIGIAVYGSKGRVILEHTSINYGREQIINAIDQLRPEGSTNAEQGIRMGYDMAEKAFRKGWINRVILCSDGVANVGRTGPDQILNEIKSQVDKGIYLSSLGFGMGNYNDVLLEQLGNKGNGYYAYIDNFDQAKKLFSNLSTALQVIGRDVKFQVEFNPDIIRSYRLIGYENRDVADKDFRDDTKDGGEINAGHSTTALYELKLWDTDKAKATEKTNAFTVYVRYKDPVTDKVEETNQSMSVDKFNAANQISEEFKLAVSSAEMAEILRGSYWVKKADLNAVVNRIESLNNQELVKLARQAKSLLDKKENNSPDTNPDTPLTKEQIEQKLRELKDLFDKGLISKEVYEQKQLELLKLMTK
ncbi:MAG: von Willebrand factor type A domain-containing protein [Sedimentisphaeraceae bacterium JB056]